MVLSQFRQYVFLPGFSDNIGQMMHNSHGVIISSHREGFSNVLVEALFYAPVLLATPVGAVVEVLPREFQVPQTDLGDKMVDLYQNYNEYTNRFDLLRPILLMLYCGLVRGGVIKKKPGILNKIF